MHTTSPSPWKLTLPNSTSPASYQLLHHKPPVYISIIHSKTPFPRCHQRTALPHSVPMSKLCSSPESPPSPPLPSSKELDIAQTAAMVWPKRRRHEPMLIHPSLSKCIAK
jgi:hypothetical protein